MAFSKKRGVKKRYPIKSEFFPFNRFTPPISEAFVRMAQKGMKTPKFIYKDPEIHTRRQQIPAYRDGQIELYVFTPKNIKNFTIWAIVAAIPPIIKTSYPVFKIIRLRLSFLCLKIYFLNQLV